MGTSARLQSQLFLLPLPPAQREVGMRGQGDVPDKVLVGEDLAPQGEELMVSECGLGADVEIWGMVWIRCWTVEKGRVGALGQLGQLGPSASV